MEEKTKKELLEDLTRVYEEMEEAMENLKQKQSDYFTAQARLLDFDNPKRKINVQS